MLKPIWFYWINNGRNGYKAGSIPAASTNIN